MVLILFFSVEALSQIISVDEMRKPPKYYKRTARVKRFKDMENMRDVLHSDKLLLGRGIFSGNISYNFGREIIHLDDKNIRKEFRSSLGLFTRIHFYEEFSLSTTFYKNFNTDAIQTWTPDFTYSFGRYNWQSGTFSYGYENFENNKYSDNFETLEQKFLRGNYFVSYTHNLPYKLINKIRLDTTSLLRLTYFIRYAIKYRDKFENSHGGLINGKPTLGVSTRYLFFKNFYIESAIYFYVNPVVYKQPWDPDFTYGFGYFYWRTFRLSVAYGNWTINRFPWNNKEYSNYGFSDGNFRIVFNYIW